MSFFREVQLDDSSGPVVALKKRYGLIPNLIRAQALAPRLIESFENLERIALVEERALSRIQKERIALVFAAALQDGYTVAARAAILCALGAPGDQIDQLLADFRLAGLTARDVALLDFCVKLGTNGTSIDSRDIENLRSNDFDDHAILEAVLACAVTRFISGLAAGLGPTLDFESRRFPSATPSREPVPASSHVHRNSGPYIKTTQYKGTPLE